MRGLVGFLRHLRRDCAGLALLEMAFVAPLLVLIVCGVADASLGFARKLVLQQAAARSVELALASGITNSTVTTLTNEAAAVAGVPTSAVTVTPWLECGGVLQSDINAICSGVSPARFISVRITDTYSSTFGSLLQTVGAGNWASVGLAGYAAVRVQ